MERRLGVCDGKLELQDVESGKGNIVGGFSEVPSNIAASGKYERFQQELVELNTDDKD